MIIPEERNTYSTNKPNLFRIDRKQTTKPGSSKNVKKLPSFIHKNKNKIIKIKYIK